MRGSIVAALAICGVVASAVWAHEPSKCHTPACGHCNVPPPPMCPKCTCPCDECRLRLCPPWKAKETRTWIEQLLHCPNSQSRKKAAAKLGCRWHADFCQTPEVLTGLIAALHCDACWEVRRTAATSLREQNARTPQAILALYLAAELDPHYLVRERANESIDILLVLQRPCYKQMLEAADKLIAKLRGKYKPGKHDCRTFYSLCGELIGEKGKTANGTPSATKGEGGEDSLPGPSNRREEAKGEEK